MIWHLDFVISHLIYMTNIEELQEKIGVKFKDEDLLLESLTHRSYINENPGWRLDHNERMEFLGDAVLELSVTDHLYRHYPNPEGELTNWRAAIVNAVILAKISAKFDLNDYIMLSRGEAKDTGRARQYILANAIEAVIGAIYLDQGYAAADEFIKRFIIGELAEIINQKLYRDAKSRFQEEAQEKVGVTPTYEVMKEWGPDHARNFVVGVYLGKELIAEGEGLSKQEAQQQAAEKALAIKGW